MGETHMTIVNEEQEKERERGKDQERKTRNIEK